MWYGTLDIDSWNVFFGFGIMSVWLYIFFFFFFSKLININDDQSSPTAFWCRMNINHWKWQNEMAYVKYMSV